MAHFLYCESNHGFLTPVFNNKAFPSVGPKTNVSQFYVLPDRVCLFVFLTSSSTTRLYRGRAPRQSVWQFYVLPHMRQSWEIMTSVSAGHTARQRQSGATMTSVSVGRIIVTPIQPVRSGDQTHDLLTNYVWLSWGLSQGRYAYLNSSWFGGHCGKRFGFHSITLYLFENGRIKSCIDLHYKYVTLPFT